MFSAGSANFTSIAFDGTTPYVAFQDNSNGHRTTVMKFDGTIWQLVGTAGFSTGESEYVNLAIDNHTPYVVYKDSSQNGKATMMSFNGTSWNVVGTPGFTQDTAENISLVFNGGIPYIAYVDNGAGNAASVMKFDGTSWVQVGDAGFTSGAAQFTAIVLIDTAPFVIYQAVAEGYAASVMKFNGTSWVQVGDANFSPGGGTADTSIATYNKSLYVAFADATNSYKASVMSSTDSNILEDSDQGDGGQDGGGVTTILGNSTTGEVVTVTTSSGTTPTCNSTETASNQYLDGTYSYPLGLVNFCFTTSSSMNQVDLVFVTDLSPSQVIARKYNPSTHEYANVPGATITDTTYNGRHALQLSYTIIDNGPLDTNPATGQITDPVGLATTTGSSYSGGAGAPNTGYKIQYMPFYACLAVSGLCTSLWAANRLRKLI